MGTGTATATVTAAAPVPVTQPVGATALMAPVSAGLAGIEVATADFSAVQPPVAPPAVLAAPATVPQTPPATGHAAAAPPAQLLYQVAQPLVRLAAAAPGEHLMTLSVTPDNLGPVTVRALISSEGVRVELFAPTETGREALRHLLPELRRDLAGGSAGTTTTLTLSDQNLPGSGNGNGNGNGSALADDRGHRTRTLPGDDAATASAAADRPDETFRHRSGLAGAAPALDVMA